MRALLAVLVLGACTKDAPVDTKTESPTAAATKAHEKAHAPVATPRPRPAQLSQVTIKALGMYCEESCPLAVRAALADHHEIYELGFDPANESIFVSYDATLGSAKQVTKPMITAIREKTGFDPWLGKEEWPADAKVQVVLR